MDNDFEVPEIAGATKLLPVITLVGDGDTFKKLNELLLLITLVEDTDMLKELTQDLLDTVV